MASTKKYSEVRKVTRKQGDSRGFTLAELLIVVAIIAILISISVPVFASQNERASRAVDMANARNIKSAIATLVQDGSVVFSKNPEKNSANGIWVLVCRDEASRPDKYGATIKDDQTTFCGADTGVIINGVESTKYLSTNQELKKAMEGIGVDINHMKVSSKNKSSVDGIDGWDWYMVEYTWNKNMKDYECRIYSGMAGKDAGYLINSSETNIEKYMSKSSEKDK